MLCEDCSKYGKCSEVKMFIFRHNLKINTVVHFQVAGLSELHDGILLEKAFALIDRARSVFGFKYIFKNLDVGVDIYLKEKDIGKNPEIFEKNEESGFLEYNHKGLL